jgi:hypothetical protein
VPKQKWFFLGIHIWWNSSDIQRNLFSPGIHCAPLAPCGSATGLGSTVQRNTTFIYLFFVWARYNWIFFLKIYRVSIKIVCMMHDLLYSFKAFKYTNFEILWKSGSPRPMFSSAIFGTNTW